MLLKSDLVERIENISAYIFASLAAVLIFFQANFSFNEFVINLNFADVLAVGAASIFILEARNKKINFLIPKVMPFVILMLVTFCYALTVGICKFGFTSYAFMSKFLGLFILIGYACLGAGFKLNFHDEDIKTLIKIMTSTLLVIVLIKEAIILLYYSKIFGDNLIITPILSGYTNNRNAFALQLLVVSCLSLVYLDATWQTIILMTAIVFTYSRSALITIAFVIFMLLLTKLVPRKKVIKILCLSLILMLGIFFAEFVINSIANIITPYLLTNSSLTREINFQLDHFSYASSNSQRLYTFVTGLKLWLKSPFTGIGLGGFVQHELLNNQVFLVIHNTFLWLLVEFGILGVSIFIWYGCVLLNYFYTRIKSVALNNLLKEEKALILIGIIFAMMGSVHEIFYQRIIWFVLGLLIVRYNDKANALRGFSAKDSLTLN